MTARDPNYDTLHELAMDLPAGAVRIPGQQRPFDMRPGALNRVDDPLAVRPEHFADTRPILGIDPGITGGIAFLYPSGCVIAIDIPNVAGEVDIDNLAGAVATHDPRAAIIERAQAMPSFPGKDGKRRGMGAASSFKFGAAYGALKAMCVLGRIPLHIVTPGKWKNHFKLDRDKEKSRALAKQFWPATGAFDRKKDHGRAEAALIARYGIEAGLVR